MPQTTSRLPQCMDGHNVILTNSCLHELFGKCTKIRDKLKCDIFFPHLYVYLKELFTAVNISILESLLWFNILYISMIVYYLHFKCLIIYKTVKAYMFYLKKFTPEEQF